MKRRIDPTNCTRILHTWFQRRWRKVKVRDTAGDFDGKFGLFVGKMETKVRNLPQGNWNCKKPHEMKVRPDFITDQDTLQRNQKECKRKPFQTSGRNCGYSNRPHPLKEGTAQLRVHDATSAIKWDISLSRDNQVHETEDAFSLTSVGGVTAHT